MPKIFLCAGDISGEIHAANLAVKLKEINSAVSVTSCGGKRLEAVSDSFVFDISSLGAFGFWEPLRQISKLKKAFKAIKESFDKSKPDKVVLVDFYGFNIHIAKLAHSLKIPVYYFISPQVWASRASRIQTLGKYITKMLVILPFEEELYKNAGIDAEFVGHPLIDMVPQAAIANLPDEKLKIGFFPGSRKSVLLKHFYLFSKTAELFKKRLNCEPIFFGVKEQAAIFSKFPYRTIYEDTGYEVRRSLNFAVSVSGTVSLETAILGIPMAVTYKLSSLNYFLAKLIVKIPYITMANILLKKEIVPELIQNKAVPEILADAVCAIISDKEKYAAVRAELAKVRQMLGQNGVIQRTAKIILEHHGL